MDKAELKQIIQESVTEAVHSTIETAVPKAIDFAVANAMGVMQENFDHQFGLVHEAITSNRETTDRKISALQEDVTYIKTRLDDIAVDVEGLKAAQHNPELSWRRS